MSYPDAHQLTAAVDGAMPLAERLFADLRTHTKAEEGVSRESYGAGEQYAHDLLAAAAKSLDLEHQSADKLKAIGVKIVADVDKSGFIRVAAPYLDKLAKELGPHAVKIKDLISAVK